MTLALFFQSTRLRSALKRSARFTGSRRNVIETHEHAGEFKEP
jgi:hypothetical protein